MILRSSGFSSVDVQEREKLYDFMCYSPVTAAESLPFRRVSEYCSRLQRSCGFGNTTFTYTEVKFEVSAIANAPKRSQLSPPVLTYFCEKASPDDSKFILVRRVVGHVVVGYRVSRLVYYLWDSG